MKEWLAIVTTVITLLVFIIGIGSCKKQDQKQNDNYNNGICSICKTPFHFVNITYVDYQGYKYIYACDNEHIIICSEEQHAH